MFLSNTVFGAHMLKSLESVPFRLMLVATWAGAWGAKSVIAAITALKGGVGIAEYLFIFEAGVLGSTALVLAILLFTSSPFVRPLTIAAFIGLAVVEALESNPANAVAVATVAVHLLAATTLVFTRQFFRRNRVDLPEDGATSLGTKR